MGEKSSLIGQTLPESQLGQKYDLNIVQIQRCDEGLMVPLQDPVLMEGDLLLVRGSSQDILKASKALGLESILDWKFEELSQESQALAEVTLSPTSQMQGKTLKQSDFRARYGLTVLAIQHHGETVNTNLADLPLDIGDALLIQGPEDRIAQLRRDRDFLILETPPLESKRLKKSSPGNCDSGRCAHSGQHADSACLNRHADRCCFNGPDRGPQDG